MYSLRTPIAIVLVKRGDGAARRRPPFQLLRLRDFFRVHGHGTSAYFLWFRPIVDTDATQHSNLIQNQFAVALLILSGYIPLHRHMATPGGSQGTERANRRRRCARRISSDCGIQ
ncbi:hypothetical protein EVAR_8056_1 [Eumeta japonica]|uniref:Uncharacterized protein n=1 Tax=Eumeta variegata TaxID=151549 RepID=A0A4C1TK73_EUMVA|nr:hypothetical protein EVAR_8056_1 [Eumeta japonica]